MIRELINEVKSKPELTNLEEIISDLEDDGQPAIIYFDDEMDGYVIYKDDINKNVISHYLKKDVPNNAKAVIFINPHSDYIEVISDDYTLQDLLSIPEIPFYFID